MKKSILLPITLLVFGCALASCGEGEGSSTPVEDVKVNLNDSYVVGIHGAGTSTPGSEVFETHQVNFYDGNIYEYVSTQITYGYSMLLGTTTNIAYGTYTVGASEDGVTSYTLNKASEVIFNSFSKMGGYNISINTASKDQTYPVEILAKVQGEKSYANSKDEVINEYGLGTVIYCDAANTFSFTDPNNQESTKAVVETASGAVNTVLNKEITKIQLASEIADGANGKEYKVYQVNMFEDNTCKYIETVITYGYGMLLGTTTIQTTGNYTLGTSEDGYTPLTVNKADDVLFNSYSKMGGYNISINTASEDQTYPVEILAKVQGEKAYANNKDEVVTEYGYERTFYQNDEKNDMSLTNPNA